MPVPLSSVCVWLQNTTPALQRCPVFSRKNSSHGNTGRLPDRTRYCVSFPHRSDAPKLWDVHWWSCTQSLHSPACRGSSSCRDASYRILKALLPLCVSRSNHWKAAWSDTDNRNWSLHFFRLQTGCNCKIPESILPLQTVCPKDRYVHVPEDTSHCPHPDSANARSSLRTPRTRCSYPACRSHKQDSALKYLQTLYPAPVSLHLCRHPSLPRSHRSVSHTGTPGWSARSCFPDGALYSRWYIPADTHSRWTPP